jgi:hypothetical protein
MKKVHRCSLAYRTRTDVGGLGPAPDDTDRSGTVSASVKFRWTGWDMQAVLAQCLMTQTGLEPSVLRSSFAGQVGTCPVRTQASTQIEFRTCGRRMVAAAAARRQTCLPWHAVNNYFVEITIDWCEGIIL